MNKSNPKSRKKSRFAKCYTLFTFLAAKQLEIPSQSKQKWNKNGMRLAIMIVKEKAKKEFGIKSMKELDKAKLKTFEQFLEKKIYD